jgi:1-acyl-sn-glycerol-3-phosphate acyltransferase
MKYLSRLILNSVGWKWDMTVEIPEKCVICVAPHTSNWDFLVGQFFYSAIGKEASFLIKNSWFFFPLNLIFKQLGGVPIDRSRSSDVTQQMAQEFTNRMRFQLAITPEGTRKRNPRWKKGFYYIALKAKVPIVLVYFDYGKKVIGIHRIFEPTGNEEADLREIKLHYKDITACHPENFTIGNID